MGCAGLNVVPYLVCESLNRSSLTWPWIAAYTAVFLTSSCKQLDDMELTQGYLKQDSAMDTSRSNVTELIESFFPNIVISERLWPPRSPDLTSPEFFLWGFLKDSVYANTTTYVTRFKGQHFGWNQDHRRRDTAASYNKYSNAGWCMPSCKRWHFQHLHWSRLTAHNPK